jgi:ABC-2 type transport system permease protein
MGARFAYYADGLLAAGGVLYVFLILSSLACNQFAYEGSGMRAFILSPLNRRTILLGKNITITTLALIISTLLIIINQIVFRDLSAGAIAFAALCFLLFSAAVALIGNWLSIRFPKRLEYGKRMNASGVAGFLLLPMLLALMVPPLVAVVAAYFTQSLTMKYATLALFAGIAVALYYLLINRQGRLLARSEVDILEAVSKRTDN